MHRRAGLGPDAPASGALRAESVRACRQGGVSSQTLVASDFVPYLVQSFKLVPIPVGGRAEITQSGECQRENLLPMRELQPGRIGNGLAKRRAASNLNRLSRQPEF